MNLEVTAYTKSENQFYPTPEALARKMISGIDFDYVHTILEPSAGKGDILRVIAPKDRIDRHYNQYRNFDIDCIEIDPYLRQILKYNFSPDRKKAILDEWENITGERYSVFHSIDRHNDLSAAQRKRLAELMPEMDTFFNNGIHIVHDDFMTFQPFKKYDLIVMNPPFEYADRHLLKALEIQKKGGMIVCLMNAETIRNPFTETRKELRRLLDQHGAEISFIENAFVSAERRTGVEVALVRVAIPTATEESEIFNKFKAAEQLDENFAESATDLEVTDFIKATVNLFNVEVKSGLELIRQYRALKPYMLKEFGDDAEKSGCILRLTDTYDRSYDDVSINEYLRKVRLKYWKALLTNKDFTGKLTSKMQKEYQEKVNSFADYDFTEFNIYTLLDEMNSKIKKGVEDEIMAMFDRLTAEHSWYPETTQNRHYFDGWATNKAHKIGKKAILPCYGIWDQWDGRPRVYSAIDIIEDVERIMNFLDGGKTIEVDLHRTIEENFNKGNTKNIPLKYFQATFYKKGTLHLVFTCPELIERFNIYAAQHKAWLPPCYGKKKYNDMTAQERAVIDGFQGQKAYENVLQKSSYFLAPVTNNQMLMLESK